MRSACVEHAFTDQDFEQALAAAHQLNMPTFFWEALLRAATLGKLDRKHARGQGTRKSRDVDQSPL